MKATYKLVSGKTNRQIANQALRAMSLICGYSNGTLKNPTELASSRLEDGRTLIQAIYEDGYVRYNDGWFIVEVEEHLYVDVTSIALKDMGNSQTVFVSDEN